MISRMPPPSEKPTSPRRVMSASGRGRGGATAAVRAGRWVAMSVSVRFNLPLGIGKCRQRGEVAECRDLLGEGAKLGRRTQGPARNSRGQGRLPGIACRQPEQGRSRCLTSIPCWCCRSGQGHNAAPWWTAGWSAPRVVGDEVVQFTPRRRKGVDRASSHLGA